MADRGGGGVGGAGGVSPDPVAFAINIAAGIMLAADIIKQNTPTLEDEVVVEVVGQPGVTKQQLYFLALAAASGLVKQIATLNPAVAFISPSAGMLMIEYDAADNWVRCTLKYQSGMAANYAFTGGPFAPNGKTLFDRLVVYRGPACDTNGAPFGFVASMSDEGKVVLATIALTGIGTALAITTGALVEIGMAGIPGDSSAAAGSPILPFAGQQILSNCPVSSTPTPTPIVQPPVPDSPLSVTIGPIIPSPNPKPPGDNRSRGAVLVPGPTIDLGAASTVTGSTGTTTGFTNLDTCCDQSLALIPLIFSALNSPATLSGATFPDPAPGITGTGA